MREGREQVQPPTRPVKQLCPSLLSGSYCAPAKPTRELLSALPSTRNIIGCESDLTNLFRFPPLAHSLPSLRSPPLLQAMIPRRAARVASSTLPTCTCTPSTSSRLLTTRSSNSRPNTLLAPSSRPILPARTSNTTAPRPATLPLPTSATCGQIRLSHSDTGPQSLVHDGPTAAYDHQVAQGLITNDDHQRSIVAILQTMHDELLRYSPPPIGPLPPPVKPSYWDRLMRSRLFADMADELHQANTATIPLPPPPANLPKGLYLFGSVGCGKSFLMDLFYAHLPEKYKQTMQEGGFGSRRVHFHQFMMDVHKKGHRIKSEKGTAQDWIVMAAREIADETRVLCFDEFQVRFPLLLFLSSFDSS